MILPSATDFIDIHSHHKKQEEGVFRIFNVFSSDFPDIPKDMAVSIGLHPWHLSAGAIEEMPRIIRKAVKFENVIAIGEAGLDKVIKTPVKIQDEAFRIQIGLSAEFQKPLIIHCVRALPELIGLRKTFKHAPAWIVHGFNGSSSLAEECTAHGIYISIGQRLLNNPSKTREILGKINVSMIFAETDNDLKSISEIYKAISGHYGMSVEILKESIRSNYYMVFKT